MYGNPEYCSEDDKELAQHISKTYSELCINLSSSMIFQSKDYFISPDLLSYALKICAQSMKNPLTIKILSPNCMTLIKEHAVPLVMLTNKDIEDFYDNPTDFIRKMKDITETFYSCRHSLKEVLLIFSYLQSSEDSTPDYLPEVLEFITESLNQCQSNTDFRVKDALLFLLENLAIIVKKVSSMHEGILKLLGEVTPYLESGNAIENYRALKVLFEYSWLPFGEEELRQVAERVYKLLHSEDTAVKLTAASTFYKFLKKPSLKPVFEPELPRILEIYLEMMKDVENEDLVNALEEIVRIFSESIEPFAVQLCK
jgi:nitrate reductase assembly molybdenum cofactor insertion protein NarJ